MARLTQSYVHGVSDIPLIGQTVGAFFDAAARRWADCDALIVRHQKLRWTYAELKRKVDDFAAGLLALGLAPGDRVGIWSPNNAEWVITQLATAKAGLILVNINPAYRFAEADYALNKVACKALVTASQFKSSDYVGMLGQLRAEGRLPHLETIIRIGGAAQGMLGFDDVPGLARPEHHKRLTQLEGELQFDEPINIQFTSGTTGLSQGRDALPPQHPQQRLLRRLGRCGLHRGRPASASRCRSITASAW
jgi:fatty-acyl-CoA synthase